MRSPLPEKLSCINLKIVGKYSVGRGLTTTTNGFSERKLRRDPRRFRRRRRRRWLYPSVEALVVGYKRVRIQYRKLLPHHAQGFARSLVLPRCGGGYLSFSLLHTSLSLPIFLSHSGFGSWSRRRSFYF